MNCQNIGPDPELTEEQRALVIKLTKQQIEEIDKALLENATNHWRKVARVVATTMMEMPERVPGIPDIFYAERVKDLVNRGFLESQGDLSTLRNSEVRIAQINENET